MRLRVLIPVQNLQVPQSVHKPGEDSEVLRGRELAGGRRGRTGAPVYGNSAAWGDEADQLLWEEPESSSIDQQGDVRHRYCLPLAMSPQPDYLHSTHSNPFEGGSGVDRTEEEAAWVSQWLKYLRTLTRKGQDSELPERQRLSGRSQQL